MSSDPIEVLTIGQVLAAYGKVAKRQETRMLKSTLRRFAGSAFVEDRSHNTLDLDQIAAAIASTDMPPTSLRAYRGYLERYRAWLGVYKPQPQLLSVEWRSIVDTYKADYRAGRQRSAPMPAFAAFATATGLRPESVKPSDVEDFCSKQIMAKRRSSSQQHQSFGIRSALAKYPSQFPLIPAPKSRTYTLPMEQWTTGVRKEFELLRDWKCRKINTVRGRWRHRPVTWRGFEHSVKGLYTHWMEQHGRHPSALAELFSADDLEAYLTWLMEFRKVGIVDCRNRAGKLRAIVNTYPPLQCSVAAQRLSDFGMQLDQSVSKNEGRLIRGIDCSLPYEKLAAIPDLMRADRSKVKHMKGRKGFACMVRDEMIIRFLLAHVWRQRNIRECRLGSPSEGGNLWKDADGVWKIFFRSDETKNGEPVSTRLHSGLVEPLEEYLRYRENILGKGMKSSVLFPAGTGREMRPQALIEMVKVATLAYAGKAICPHWFRHAFASQFLADRPGDYLTLQRIMWHKNLKITTELYGSGYNTEAALTAVEAWHADRAKQKSAA